MPTIGIDGLQVAYDDSGYGLPVVFIPGLVGTREWFRLQAHGLNHSYRIISYDVRAARGMVPYTLDLLARDLAGFLESLKQRSAVIVGHSFGGMIAQQFALRYPQAVEGLVLLSSFPSFPKLPRETMLEWLSPGRVNPESRLAGLVRRVFRAERRAPSSDLEGLDWLTAQSSGISPRTIKARLALVSRFDSRGLLSGMQIPTLVVVGANDRAPFLSGAQLIYEGIPGSSLEVVEDGDHFCFFTRHDIINALIDDFLTERIVSI